MVYCGKPSRGCQMCRTRRIKCDETKPTCNQCAKSRRECPGYKDEFDLILRNETKATERRALKANKKNMGGKGTPPAAGTSTFSTSGSVVQFEAYQPPGYQETLILPGRPEKLKQRRRRDQDRDPDQEPSQATLAQPQQLEAPMAALQIPTDQVASCHFVSNFVLIPTQLSGRGWMEFILPLIRSGMADNTVIHAFNACALASFGNRYTSDGINLTDMARSEYTKALAATHAALKNPEASNADSTLGAVLLLGFFESLATSQQVTYSWGSHIEGAIHILKARGRKQLKTKIGYLLFMAVRSQMIIHSLTSGTPPAMGLEWWLIDNDKEEAFATSQRLAIKTAELRAEVPRLMGAMTRTSENIEVMLDVMKRVQNVDLECAQWIASQPAHLRYRTVAWEDNVPNGDYGKAEVFPGRVDMYPCLLVACTWNMVRTSRLVLSSILVRCAAWVCAPVNYKTTPEYARAQRVCVDTIADIIASVPYQLGWHHNRKDINDRHDLSGFACGMEESQKGLAGYLLTWPLGIVITQDYPTDAQRAWAVGRLKYIGGVLGVRYANIIQGLQIRVPSMLIRKDGLMATPYAKAYDFEKIIAGRMASAGEAPKLQEPGKQLTPQEMRDLMTSKFFEQKHADMMLARQNSQNGLPEPPAQPGQPKGLELPSQRA